MAYVLWIPVGIVCGAALGFVGPFGMFLYSSWALGERAAGIGTPLSLLTLITVPSGALVGAYAGAQRATHGRWAGNWSASRSGESPSGEKIAPVRKSPGRLEVELAAMSHDDALRAKREYLSQLKSEYGSKSLNYWLVATLVLIGLLFHPFLLVPILVALRLFWAKFALRQQIQEAENVRPDLVVV